MISLSWDSSFEPNKYDADKQIGLLVGALREMPRHIAKKHMKAAFKKTLRPAVPLLRKNTPPLGTRRGRKAKGAKRTTGELRRSVTVKTGQTGRNSDFDSFVYGVLGYKFKGQDRKAIWLNFGTSGGIKPYDMIGKTMQQFGPVCSQKLAVELGAAVEKAAKELSSKKNPGRTRGL